MTKGSCHKTVESKVQKWVKPAASARWASSITFLAGALVCATSPNSISASTSLVASRESSQASVEATLQEPAGAGLADVLVVLDDDRAPREHRRRPTLNLHALVGGVVHVHVVGGGRDRVGAVGIVDHDVGVRSRRDDALAGEQPEHLGRRGRGDVHPAPERDLAHIDALEDEVQPVLDAGQAIGDLGEVANAHFLVLLEAEGAVVGRDEAEVVGAKTAPQLGLITLGPQRRRTDVLGALEAFAR